MKKLASASIAAVIVIAVLVFIYNGVSACPPVWPTRTPTEPATVAPPTSVPTSIPTEETVETVVPVETVIPVVTETQPGQNEPTDDYVIPPMETEEVVPVSNVVQPSVCPTRIAHPIKTIIQVIFGVPPTGPVTFGTH